MNVFMKRGHLVIIEAGQVEQVVHPVCTRCFVHRAPYQLRLLRVHAKNTNNFTLHIHRFTLLYTAYTAKKITILYFLKSNCVALFPISIFIHLHVNDLYIPRIGPPILLQPNWETDRGNI
jgi:hypothetical protein